MRGLLLGCLLSACFRERTEQRLDDTRVVTVQHDFANTHAVVLPSGDVVLVDSGLERNAERLEASLRQAAIDPARVKWVVVTHGHADHAGGARHFQKRFGAQVVAGEGDVAMLAAGQNGLLCPTDSTGRGRVAQDQNERFVSLVPDVVVGAAMTLTDRVEILPMAGHTEGSLVVRVGSVVLVGDLFRGSIFGSSAERHFYMCDLADNARDVRALLGTWPTAETFLVGHFGPLTRHAVEAAFPVVE